MVMHMKNHLNRGSKKCHYYNNDLVCPFQEMGCMFIHEDSPLCRFDGKCSKRLCSFKHRKIVDKAVVDENLITVGLPDENNW